MVIMAMMLMMTNNNDYVVRSSRISNKQPASAYSVVFHSLLPP